MSSRPTIRLGSTGQEVVLVQTCLQAFPLDGIFGPKTEDAVKRFQAQENLEPDGIVGPQTWAALERVYNLPPPPPPRLLPSPFNDVTISLIGSIAMRSAIARYHWKDRGVAPAGYTKGMAVAYGYIYRKWLMRDPAVLEMAKASTHNAEVDVLAYYASIFHKARMDNDAAGVDTLRHLIALQMGLGMRESGGKHCCGRDMSAENTTADTCEAGAFQMSWNMETSSPQMQKLMDQYSSNPPQCSLKIWHENVQCSEADWSNYGSGDGAKYQKLAKDCPQFSVETVALGLRKRRNHWGPINRYEVELRNEADGMLLTIQELVDSLPPDELGSGDLVA